MDFVVFYFAHLKVSSKKKDVLLGQNDRWFATEEPLYFSSERAVWGLSLAGLPGSEGFIQISVYETNLRQARGNRLNLEVYFRLRECHLGFLNPVFENANQVNYNYSNFFFELLNSQSNSIPDQPTYALPSYIFEPVTSSLCLT